MQQLGEKEKSKYSTNFYLFPKSELVSLHGIHSSSVKSWFFFDIGGKRKIKRPENYEAREVISIRFNE